MTASRWKSKKRTVFQSVFQQDIAACSASDSAFSSQLIMTGPAALDATAPLASVPLCHSFSGVVSEHQHQWDRAWHCVTAAIRLPSSVAVEDSFGSLPASQDPGHGDLYTALSIVLRPHDHIPDHCKTADIFAWHTQQVRHHFAQHVLPLLSACDASGDPFQTLLGTIRTLEAANRQYLYGLTLIARGLGDAAANIAITRFRRDLFAIIGNSMSKPLMGSVALVVGKLVKSILCVDTESHAHPDKDRDTVVHASRTELLGLLASLAGVGLAGDKFQVMYAEMMDLIMDKFIRTSYERRWPASNSLVAAAAASGQPSQRDRSATSTASPCIPALRDWVENHYSRLIFEVLNQIGSRQVVWSDVDRWKDLAVGRLSAIRIKELFDIVLHWPESRPDLLDLKMSVTTPQRRLQLTDTFSGALRERLLHPGRSTLEILQVYIAMIRTFHALDHSKVLLDRVVRSLQLYLCQRDDAIRIVVTGLLSSPDSSQGRGNKLVELAALLNDPSQPHRRQSPDDEEIGWDDMDWVPDPTDAGVNYKRPKSEDVIGTLIGALGAKDVFIKEFQAIMGERLLSPRTQFTQEIKVLNLMKRRFGENALQNCDVMLKDIQDSKSLNGAICRHIGHARQEQAEITGRPSTAPICHAKILSRLFWPPLQREFVVVPPPVAEAQQRYQRTFEDTKGARKLTWLDNMGTAMVHLELEDRIIELECQTVEAAVIYAFQDDNRAAGQRPCLLTVDELEASLMLDRGLVEESLRFWVKQGVLRQARAETYVVIENSDHDAMRDEQTTQPVADETTTTTTTTKAPAGWANLGSQEDERRHIYWQFIVGMLTNSAPAMPLANMAMMMKMLIPDGFAWSNENLHDFLSEKVAEQELEFSGGKYRLPKKQ